MNSIDEPRGKALLGYRCYDKIVVYTIKSLKFRVVKFFLHFFVEVRVQVIKVVSHFPPREEHLLVVADEAGPERPRPQLKKEL